MCNPFGRRICCNVDPDEISAVEPEHDEGIEQVEPIVGTTNRPMAAMSGAWLCKKVRHPWLGGLENAARILVGIERLQRDSLGSGWLP
jgi:hypothetical protein